MGYINKGATLFLFLFLLVALLSFGGSTVYYQKSFSRLNSELSEKNDKISSLTYTLNSLSSNHSKLNELLNLKIQREIDLTGQYEDVQAEKESITTEKLSVEGELNFTKSSLKSALLNITILNDEIEDMNLSIIELQEDYEDLFNETVDICEEAASLNISECEDYIE